MKSLIVSFEDNEKNLITYLTSKFPNLNVNAIYKAIRKKDIKINGKRISQNIKLSYNDKLDVYISDDILLGNKKTIDIPVVFEDENVVVFNKPINLEVDGNNSLASIMKDKYNYLMPCHRIDRNTTGLVLFAKNEISLNIITNLFKNYNIEKHYIACVYGISKPKAMLTDYLFKDSKKALVYISNEPKKGYTKIQTSYSTILQNKDKKLSLLDVTLHTGKTHQIRAHLSYVGLPLLGDGKYGSYEINKRFKMTTQALCSYSITFHIDEDNYLSYLNGTTIKLKKVPFLELMK